MIVKNIFSKRWLFTSLIVFLGFAVLVRLGLWQLDRLAQRREFNARIFEQIDAPEFNISAENYHENLYDMEYRPLNVTGHYDFNSQVALRNQYSNNQLGVHLLTPLLIENSENIAILIDRGWIPQEDASPENWGKYDEIGTVDIDGIIRRSEITPQLNMLPDPTLAPGQSGLDVWSQINLERIVLQSDHKFLNVYLQQVPSAGLPELPERTEPDIDLDDGPHLGYALQWFVFSLILISGYPFYIRTQEEKMGNEINENKNEQ